MADITMAFFPFRPFTVDVQHAHSRLGSFSPLCLSDMITGQPNLNAVDASRASRYELIGLMRRRT